jgi:chitodextrinase
MIAWTPATDDGDVLYDLWLNDTLHTEGLTENSTVLEELAPLTSYTARVVAKDTTGHITEDGPQAGFSTLDITAPTFAEGDVLMAEANTDGLVSLNWPAATDNVAVANYEVKTGNTSLIQVDGDTLTAPLEAPVADGESLTVQLIARDASGNVSVPGLSLTIESDDTTAPAFPDSASLVISSITPNSATLAWTPATDNVSVVAYRVYLNGDFLQLTPALALTLDELLPGSVYDVEIRAIDGLGNESANSLTGAFATPDLAPPTWDAGALTVSDVTPSSLTLAWPAASDDVAVMEYDVRQDGALLGTVPADTLTMEVTALNPWTTYTFEVFARDINGNLSWESLSATAKTSDNSPPTWASGALEVTAVTANAVSIAWPLATDDVGVVNCKIMVDGAIGPTLSGDVTTTTITGLTPWTDISFQVTAFDAAGNASTALEVAVKTGDIQAPVWPSDANLQVTVSADGKTATVDWPEALDDGEGASYTLTVDGFEVGTYAWTTTEGTLADLKAGSVILVAVSPRDAADNVGMPLTATVSVPDVEVPTWPEAFASWSATQNTVTLTWSQAQDNVGVSGYRVYQLDTLVAETGSTSAVISNLEPGQSYPFTIQAGDTSGNWSEDGPSATAITEDIYDPGFRRLSRTQYNASLANILVAAYPYCYDSNGQPTDPYVAPCKVNWSLSSVFKTLESAGYGEWKLHAKNYPTDERIRAENELRGGHKRLDNRVFDAHASAWTSAAMNIAKNYYDGPGDYNGPAGLGDDMVWAPCQWDNDAGITNFATIEELQEHCISEFIWSFGRKVFRRPLTMEQHDALMEIYYADLPQYGPSELQTTNGPGFHGENAAVWRRTMRNTVATMLSSPYFLYHVELGDDAGNLTAHELANRLSYHFWNQPPDEELAAVADDNTLVDDPDVYSAQVNRLASDTRALSSVKEFYEGYFRTDDMVDLLRQTGAGTHYHSPYPNEDTSHIAAPGGGSKYYHTAHLRTAMQRELLNLGAWYTWTEPGTYADMFQSNKHFLECINTHNNVKCSGAGPYSYYAYGIGNVTSRSEGIAANWCVDEEPGSCEAMGYQNTATGYRAGTEPVDLPGPNRHGLLTRISFLAHDTKYKRPIRRGLKIREMLLCDPVPPPENCDVVKPPNVSGHCEAPDGTQGGPCMHVSKCNEDAGEVCVNPNLEVELTTREKVELITEEPGTTCYGCHATTINGFGHALGHYSSEGRYREKEPMFSTLKAAHWKSGIWNFMYYMRPEEDYAPIDDTGTTLYKGEWVEIDGAEELATFLLNTGGLEWCWAREYFRFSHRRLERAEDLASIEEMAEQMRNGMTLSEAFKSIAFTPQFKALDKPTSVLEEVQP